MDPGVRTDGMIGGGRRASVSIPSATVFDLRDVHALFR